MSAANKPHAPHTWGDKAHGEDPEVCTSCAARKDWPLAKQPCTAANVATGRVLELGEVLRGTYTVQAVRRTGGTRIYTMLCSGCCEQGEVKGRDTAKVIRGVHRPMWCCCGRRARMARAAASRSE